MFSLSNFFACRVHRVLGLVFAPTMTSLKYPTILHSNLKLVLTGIVSN